MNLLDGINDTEDELYTFDSIIETEDKDSGLEAFNRILGNDYFNLIITSRTNGKKQYANDIVIVEKALKALEIIKKYFWLEDFQDFVAFNGRLPKSLKEELDLLKEVLL